MTTSAPVSTNHAYDRAKERLGWNAKVLDKMMNKAYNEGIRHSEAKGNLKKYITKLWLQYRSANNIRIYGEDIYFFADHVLITLYRMPSNLTKYIKISKK